MTGIMEGFLIGVSAAVVMILLGVGRLLMLRWKEKKDKSRVRQTNLFPSIYSEIENEIIGILNLEAVIDEKGEKGLRIVQTTYLNEEYMRALQKLLSENLKKRSTH